ncbi:PEP-CTERM sorting domain-containing protein [Novosphingobium panipatense]|uniref:PEP-CTERM sorting domain-containing protein n=1 Tax=Novosphingobium TaxID=165696 RepID=UPI00351110E5
MAIEPTEGFALPRLKVLPAIIAASLPPFPAHAAGGIPLPEPSGLMLLGIGVAGVVIGRRFSVKRRDD